RPASVSLQRDRQPDNARAPCDARGFGGARGRPAGGALKGGPVSEGPLAGKRVLIRADLNVPQDDAGTITDDTRIRASIPGIRAALARGAAVMSNSHLGRPTQGE